MPPCLLIKFKIVAGGEIYFLWAVSAHGLISSGVWVETPSPLHPTSVSSWHSRATFPTEMKLPSMAPTLSISGFPLLCSFASPSGLSTTPSCSPSFFMLYHKYPKLDITKLFHTTLIPNTQFVHIHLSPSYHFYDHLSDSFEWHNLTPFYEILLTTDILL